LIFPDQEKELCLSVLPVFFQSFLALQSKFKVLKNPLRTEQKSFSKVEHFYQLCSCNNSGNPEKWRQKQACILTKKCLSLNTYLCFHNILVKAEHFYPLFFFSYEARRKILCRSIQRIIAWLELEGTFKDHLVPTPCYWLGCYSLNYVAQNYIQPDLEHFRDGASTTFLGSLSTGTVISS